MMARPPGSLKTQCAIASFSWATASKILIRWANQTPSGLCARIARETLLRVEMDEVEQFKRFLLAQSLTSEEETGSKSTASTHESLEVYPSPLSLFPYSARASRSFFGCHFAFRCTRFLAPWLFDFDCHCCSDCAYSHFSPVGDVPSYGGTLYDLARGTLCGDDAAIYEDHPRVWACLYGEILWL